MPSHLPTHRPTRHRRRATTCLVAGAALAAMTTAAGDAPRMASQTAPASTTASTVSPSARSWPVGTPIEVERLNPALWLPGTSRAFRVRYVSTGYDGRERIVGGAVFIPNGTPPAGGWPVISWGHGTVGVADRCAPSVNPRSPRDATYLGGWLRAGYAVVSTDYEGLGTPGDHPYLHGRSAAFAVVDMVRAARHVEVTLGRRWLAVGQSQGAQAALFVGALEREYGHGLDYRGAIATAPPTQWRTTFAAVKPFVPDAPANPLVPLVIAGARTAAGDRLGVGDYLTERGRALLAATMSRACVPELAATVAGKRSGEFFAVDSREEARLIRALVGYGEAPIRRHSAPIFIAQGEADQLVLPVATRTTAAALAKAGNHVTFRSYPGADHSGVLAAVLPEALAWAKDRLR